MSAQVSCRCCGIPLVPGTPYAQHTCCAVCFACTRVHGDALQAKIVEAVGAGRLDPYRGLLMAIVDDALLTGQLVLVQDHAPDGTPLATGSPLIIRAPRRWEVVAARALARGQAPDVQAVIDAAMRPHWPGPPTEERIAAMKIEIRDALAFVTPHALEVDVVAEPDPTDPGSVSVSVKVRGADPATIQVLDDVELPDDIMLRPRGQA